MDNNNNQKVEIKVNVINQLLMAKNSSFDSLTFLDEDVQNAQRAGSKNVWISFDSYSRTLTIENDGGILKDPQVLFSMSDSGWDDTIKENENPFGMGFFSNISVSDYIEIFSGHLHVVFDIGKMLEENRTDIKVEEVDDYYDGFKMVLQDISDEIYAFNVEEHVSLLGKYVHDLNIFYNGELKERADLTEGDNSTFMLSINEDSSFMGWLALDKGWSDGVNVFYKGRLVKKINEFLYLKGDIHINDKILTLRAPDRKDIIKNKMYREFKERINFYAELLCEQAIENGLQEDIDSHASAISHYANKDEIKKKMKFLTFEGSNEKDVTYLKDVAIVIKKEGKDKIDSFENYKRHLQDDKYQIESEDEISVSIMPKSEVPEAKGIVKHPESYTSGSTTEAYTERPSISEKETNERIASMMIQGDTPTFWMRFDDIDAFEQKFNIISHYDLNLIISRNKFEDEVLKAMKNDNVIHVSQLEEKITISADISNTILSTKEKRASLLLGMLSSICGFEKNVFVIGDLMVTKNIQIDAINKSFTMIEEDINVVSDSLESIVYVDRLTIENSMLESNASKELSVNDYKFLLANMPNFIKEISLLEFDNKDDLYQKTMQALSVA